ncbi:MAG: DUF262 domain-containing protein [Anaerolineales bacterium]|nr:DUF262 domain-containing protein [Anaerolineales bacterium]
MDTKAADEIVEDEMQYSDTLDFEFEGTDSDDELPLAVAAAERRLLTDAKDPEIESLCGRWKRGKLILQPDFQRHFVWDRAKASRLIESALLQVPLPIVYLAEEVDGTVSVIDGQQRLTSFFSFMDGRLPTGQVFALSGLDVFPELNGKTYAQMDESLQDAVRYCQIRTITILNGSNADIKFEIFKRLNTGAMPLNDMEVRNCVYRGPYMQLLKELAGSNEFRSLVGFKEPDRRMRDVELVLRFAAFYHASFLRYQSPMKKFLNTDMENYRQIRTADANDLRKGLANALYIVKSLFGDRAFRRFIRGDEMRPNGEWETRRFNASLYDVLLGTFARVEKSRAYAALDTLREGILDLMTSNQEFIDAILLGTSEQRRVIKRFDLMWHLVDDILEGYPRQPRCFSMSLKRELYDRDRTCAICGQEIQHIDDAAVDHIEQYWRGGRTIPENARLTHRYCNWARARND